MLIEQQGHPIGTWSFEMYICFRAFFGSASLKVLVSAKFISLMITIGMWSRGAHCGFGFDVVKRSL